MDFEVPPQNGLCDACTSFALFCTLEWPLIDQLVLRNVLECMYAELGEGRVSWRQLVLPPSSSSRSSQANVQSIWQISDFTSPALLAQALLAHLVQQPEKQGLRHPADQKVERGSVQHVRDEQLWDCLRSDENQDEELNNLGHDQERLHKHACT